MSHTNSVLLDYIRTLLHKKVRILGYQCEDATATGQDWCLFARFQRLGWDQFH